TNCLTRSVPNTTATMPDASCCVSTNSIQRHSALQPLIFVVDPPSSFIPHYRQRDLSSRSTLLSVAKEHRTSAATTIAPCCFTTLRRCVRFIESCLPLERLSSDISKAYYPLLARWFTDHPAFAPQSG